MATSLLDKLGAKRQTIKPGQYVSNIVEPYRDLGKQLYEEEAFTRTEVKPLSEKLKEQTLDTYETRRDTRLNQQDIERKQEKEVKETASERAKMLERQISDKYGIEVKRSFSPIQFTNMVMKIPADRREQFKKDYNEYTLEIERSNPFRAGAEAGFNVLPTKLESTQGKETVESAPNYNVGRFVGGAGQQLAFGSVLGAPIEGAVGRVLPKATPFLTETLKDVAIGTGTQLLETPFDKPTVGQFATNTAIDIALNALFGVVGKSLSNVNAIDLKNAKTSEIVENVARDMNVTSKEASDMIDKSIDDLMKMRTQSPRVEPVLAPRAEMRTDTTAINLRQPETLTNKVDENGITLYHGTWRKHKGFEPGRDFYFTPDKEFAESFIREPKPGTNLGGELLEGKIKTNAKILDTRTPEGKKIANEIISSDEYMNYRGVDSYKENKFENGLPKFTADDFISEVKNKGYDGVILAETLGKEGTTSFRLFNPDAIEVQTPQPTINRPSEFTVKPKKLTEKLAEPTPITDADPILKKFQLDLFGAKPDAPVEADFKGNTVKVTGVNVENGVRYANLDNGTRVNVNELKPKKEPIDTLTKILVDTPKKPAPTISQNLERTYQELFSKVAPFESLARKTDIPLLRAQATNLNRTTGTVDYNISKAQSDMDGNNIGDSIQTIFKTVKETERPQFYDYVFNKHNLQRANPETYVRKEDLELFREYRSLKEQLEIDPKNRAVRERLKQFDDLKTEFDNLLKAKPVFGETVTPEISSKKIAQYDQANPQFKDQQEKITKYFSNLLNEWGVKSGLVSEETAKMLNEMYPNYVPTYRAVDIARAMNGDGNFVSQILKKAKGSELSILPLDQQMAILTDRTIRNARKNEVMNMLDDVYQANPEIASRYIFEVKKSGDGKVDDILDVGRELEKPAVKDGDKYTVTFYRNGEPHQMTINKVLYEAITTHERDAVDNVLNTIKTYATNPFKSLITQKNPIFFVRNVMRDIPTALIYSNDSLGLVRNTPVAVKEMLSNGKLWQQFQAMGGTRSGLFNYEKGVKLEFDGKKNALKETGKKISSGLELANNMTETLPRFAEYITAIKKGEPPMLAMMRAAEITTDFARFGNVTKKADAVVPYLNASMQGLDKFARQMRDKPLQTMAKGGLVVAIPALILDQVNKDNQAYNEMTPFERNNYYHIPKEDGTFYRIPRSREVGVLFGTMLEWASRKARGQEVTGEEIKEVLKSNFTPVNGFDSNIIKPALNFIDIATGKNPDAKNYFGSNIVSESLQRYSPKEQYTESTTKLSKALGAYLDVPPVAIDYLLDSYLGVVADIGMPLLTDNKKNALSPFTKAFVADPVFKSDNVNKFYNSLDKLNQLSTDMNRNYDIPSEQVTPYEKVRNELNKVSKELSELRKQQKEAQSKNNDELVRQLRERMNAVSKKATDSLPTEEQLKKQFELYLKKGW